MGFNAFVISHRIQIENIVPLVMEDVASAVKIITGSENAFDLKNQDYIVAGFSSGGHVAGLWCSERHGWAKHELPRPAACFLDYPLVVVSYKAIMLKYGMGTPRDIWHSDKTTLCVGGPGYTRESLEHAFGNGQGTEAEGWLEKAMEFYRNSGPRYAH